MSRVILSNGIGSAPNSPQFKLAKFIGKSNGILRLIPGGIRSFKGNVCTV